MRTYEVLRRGSAVALADLAAVYTWRTWLLGWLARMLCQVVFFTLAGRLIGGPGSERFLVVGNALMACVIESTMVVASTAWERGLGTLPLLVSAPTRLAWAFVGRSMQWVISGVATSLVGLLVLGPLFGVMWSPRAVVLAVPLVAATAVGSYFFALALAALVLNKPGIRNIVSNVAYLGMMAICGVQVPVGRWPAPVRAAADLLPLTSELSGLRRLLDGAPLAGVLGYAALGLLSGVGWLLAALLAFRLVAERGRRNGTIEFGS